MIREIEFRGKRKIDNTWIYGGYMKTIRTNKIQINGTSRFCTIHPETIGQYTGLTDKNGTKIFEGDIILSQEFRNKPFSKNYKKKRLIGIVEYYERKNNNQVFESGYKVKFINDDEKSFYNCGAWGDFYDCEVIGNIYDNPELLTHQHEGKGEK